MTDDWRPTARLDVLRRRAEILAAIRSFFASRGVLEVEAPLLGAAPVTDLHLHALATRYRGPGHDGGRELWLQTSPEFAMKRLLAAGCGPIYSLGKAFRDGEAGSRHNPEFTLLEWYRPGWDHHRLMDEVEALLGAVLGRPDDTDRTGSARRVPGSNCVRHDQGCVPGIPSHRAPGPVGASDAPPQFVRQIAEGDDSRLTTHDSERLTYAEAFLRHAGIDPHRASLADLARIARERIGGAPDLGDDRDSWLELLLSHLVEPELGRGRPTFVHDFPASQAALARVRPGEPPLAERFEVFVEGLELANGYHELVDPVEQRRRFEADLAARRARGIAAVPIDERLLAAMAHGLPECSGVALGVDRLVMLAVGAERLDEVIPFPVDRA